MKIGIIGSGPGGYVAALRGAQLGAEIVIFEKENLGGVCLNKGCIPTKAIISSINLLRQAKESEKYGLKIENVSFDISLIIKRSEQIVNQLRQGINYLLKKRNVNLITGNAKILKPNLIEIKNKNGNLEQMEFDKIIIASGSSPFKPSFFPFDQDKILISDEILKIEKVPESLIIIGAGAIGIEFATIFAELGTSVTLIEMMPQILPEEDDEIVDILFKEMKKKIKIKTNTKIEKISIKDGFPLIETSQGEKLKAEKVLVVVGRDINNESFKKLNILMDEKYIKTNNKMETSISGIYAIGDLTGPPFLAHKASAQGIVAIQNALEKETIMNNVIPSCIFSFPEIARVGLTEKQVQEKKYQYKIGKFPFQAIGKAITSGEYVGMVKVIVDAETNKILGAHIIGNNASNLIHEIALAIKSEISVEDVATLIHAHPTLSEGIAEACDAVFGRQIHYV
ncbi:MAG: dihydrolipoyl dehydrogenase [bacterium]